MIVDNTRLTPAQQRRIVASRNTARSLRRAKVAQALGEELKTYDATLIAAAITAGGTIWHLSDVGLGDSQNQRIGKKITMKYLYMRVNIELSTIL